MARENSLGTASVKSLVLRLALPSMLAQFVNVLYGIVDRMYIGNIAGVGDVALAGAGVCGPIVTLISSFAFLVGIGGAPLLAIRLGEDNQDGAERILGNCFLMLLVLSGVLTAFFITFRKPLLMLFGASANTFVYANEYLTIYTLGTVFAILAAGLNQFIICQGYSKMAMFTVLIGAVLNIVLDPIFIFVFNMGVGGAALATVLSQAASALFVLSFLLGIRPHVRITFGRYSWKIMRQVLAFGLSPFIIIATDSVLIIVLNSTLQRYGGAQSGDLLITCATIVQSYMQLLTLPLGGITSGVQPILSFNYGAKNTARIRLSVKYTLALCLCFCTLMFLLAQIMPQFFVLIFTRNATLIDLSVWGIRVFMLGAIPLALQYTFVDSMTALGIAKVAISLSLFRKTSFMLLLITLPLFFGATGAFYAEPIADVMAGIVSSTIFALLFSRILKKREQMPDGQALYG